MTDKNQSVKTAEEIKIKNEPIKTALDLIKEKYPFYDPLIAQRDIALNGEQVSDLMESYASQSLPQQPVSAGLRWRDAKKEHPQSADSYHVKVLEKDGDGYTFPAVLCYTMGVWEVMEENHEVIFWLDENN